MSSRSDTLDRLQAEIPRLWRGRGNGPAGTSVLPSGHPPLDELLPGGGWPVGALTELLYPRPGLGELSLFLPVLRQCSQSAQRVALIAPPLLPNGPALAARGVVLQQLLLIRCTTAAERRWAAEQCLRSGLFGCLLLWPGRCADQDLRRLQLAAEQSQTLTVLYRDPDCRLQASPAQLRLLLQASDQRSELLLFKARGLNCSTSAPLRPFGDSQSWRGDNPWTEPLTAISPTTIGPWRRQRQRPLQSSANDETTRRAG